MPSQATQAQRLTAAEAAAETRIPKRTILYHLSVGNLRGEKVGNAGYVIARTDLDRWLAKRAA